MARWQGLTKSPRFFAVANEEKSVITKACKIIKTNLKNNA